MLIFGTKENIKFFCFMILGYRLTLVEPLELSIISLFQFQLSYIIVAQLNHIFNHGFYLFLMVSIYFCWWCSEVKALVLPPSFILRCEHILWWIVRGEVKQAMEKTHWVLSCYIMQWSLPRELWKLSSQKYASSINSISVGLAIVAQGSWEYNLNKNEHTLSTS